MTCIATAEQAELTNFFLRNPWVVKESVVNLERKVEYLFETMGGTASQLRQCPAFLSFDLDKHTRPRAEFLRALGYQPLYQGLPFLLYSTPRELSKAVKGEDDLFTRFNEAYIHRVVLASDISELSELSEGGGTATQTPQTLVNSLTSQAVVPNDKEELGESAREASATGTEKSRVEDAISSADGVPPARGFSKVSWWPSASLAMARAKAANIRLQSQPINNKDPIVEGAAASRNRWPGAPTKDSNKGNADRSRSRPQNKYPKNVGFVVEGDCKPFLDECEELNADLNFF